MIFFILRHPAKTGGAQGFLAKHTLTQGKSLRHLIPAFGKPFSNFVVFGLRAKPHAACMGRSSRGDQTGGILAWTDAIPTEGHSFSGGLISRFESIVLIQIMTANMSAYNLAPLRK